eukprot:8254568-Alexandrium_andersonii.AAC.1
MHHRMHTFPREVNWTPDSSCRCGWAAQPPAQSPELPRSSFCAVLRAESDGDGAKRTRCPKSVEQYNLAGPNSGMN